MPLYKKKPVVIEARQFLGGYEHACELATWCGGDPYEEFIKIMTLEGLVTADVGDWIIRGVKDEFYPCKPDIFALTYEATPGVRAPYKRGISRIA